MKEMEATFIEEIKIVEVDGTDKEFLKEFWAKFQAPCSVEDIVLDGQIHHKEVYVKDLFMVNGKFVDSYMEFMMNLNHQLALMPAGTDKKEGFKKALKRVAKLQPFGLKTESEIAEYIFRIYKTAQTAVTNILYEDKVEVPKDVEIQLLEERKQMYNLLLDLAK